MEGGVIDMKEESGCDKKDKCVPGKVMLVKKKKKTTYTLKEFSDILWHWKFNV